MNPAVPRKRLGRPCDPDLGPNVLEITRRLVNDLGVKHLTVEAIAREAKVSKQSLYRRWPSKIDMIFEAFVHRVHSFGEVPDGPVSEMLETFLTRWFRGLQVDGKAIAGLIAMTQEDDAFRLRYREEFSYARGRQMRAILERGVERGELPADADLSLAVEMAHGTFWYRLLLGQPLNEDFARNVACQIIGGLKFNG